MRASRLRGVRAAAAVAVVVAGLGAQPGCASLETDVRLFDGSCLDEAKIIDARGAQVAGLLDAGAFAKAKDELRTQADLAWTTAGLPAEQRVGYDAEIETLAGELERARIANTEGLAALEGGKLKQAKLKFVGANAAVAAMAERYGETIVAIFDGGELDLSELSEALAAMRRELVGGELFDDPRLAMVLYSTTEDRRSGSARSLERAAEGCWSARIDHTRTVANIGNADIAVTMRDDGTFTVKGMRLDASQVTQALFKLSTQAVCLAAGLSGVGGCPMTGTGTASGRSDADFDFAGADAEVHARKRAALQMLEEIVAVEPGVRSTNKAKRQAATEAVTQTIDASLPALETELEVRGAQ